MRYVICHGRLRGQSTFVNHGPRVGLYVEQLGQLMLQQETVPIVRNCLPPVRSFGQESIRDLDLIPLTEEEYSTVRMALRDRADDPDVYFLPASTTLSALVASLDEEEDLRLIACTAAEGAPRVGTTEQILGLTVQKDAPQAYRGTESRRIDLQAGQLLLKRKKSEQLAADYITSLGELAAELWLSNFDTHASMMEWSLRRLPAVTTDAQTWQDTLHFLLTQSSVANSLLSGNRSQVYPGYGDAFRARMQQINTFAAAWPDNLATYVAAWDPKAPPGMILVRTYLSHRAASPEVAAVTTTFLALHKQLTTRAAAIAPSDPATWHAYLEALRAITPNGQIGPHPLIDTRRCQNRIAESALAQRNDFDLLWTALTRQYPHTVVPLLRQAAQDDAWLHELIETAESTSADTRYRTPSQTFVDGMDLEPHPGVAISDDAIAPGDCLLPCASCGTSTEHSTVPQTTPPPGPRSVSVCRRCFQVIGQSPHTTYRCHECHSHLFLHQACR